MIRTAIIFFLFIGLTSFHFIKQSGLTVSITNLRNDKGHVLISLFKNGDGYPDKPDKAFRKEKLSIKNNKASVVFNDLPAGDYAIAILHDEDDDLRMNKTWLGLPKEGYGFSNNVMGTFGPPSYSKAKFAHSNPSSQEIKTRY
ncbi:MAG TPA: DUF2141 domain-containing protein [Chitinophagaceae bacterium]